MTIDVVSDAVAVRLQQKIEAKRAEAGHSSHRRACALMMFAPFDSLCWEASIFSTRLQHSAATQPRGKKHARSWKSALTEHCSGDAEIDFLG
jgi:hypothetical protein